MLCLSTCSYSEQCMPCVCHPAVAVRSVFFVCHQVGVIRNECLMFEFMLLL